LSISEGTIANIIAGIAVFMAIFIPVTQYIYERKREWHSTCEILLHSFEKLYEDIDALVSNPRATNLIAFQHLLNMRAVLLEHYAKKFILQRKRIHIVRTTIYMLAELPLNTVYEKIILQGTGNNGYHTEGLNKEVRNFIFNMCKRLIE
jgi:hypothetical protein